MSRRYTPGGDADIDVHQKGAPDGYPPDEIMESIPG